MSFCHDCKDEIMQLTDYQECCRSSLIYGYLCFFSKIGRNEFSISCEYVPVLRYLVSLLNSSGIRVEESCIESGKRKSTLRITDTAICERIMDEFLFSNSAPAYSVDQGFFMCDNCRRAFIAGAFLAAGSVTEPSKSYHIEFATHRTRIASGLEEIMSEMGFEPRSTERGYDTLVYFKASEQIEDLLTTMGCFNGSMKLMEAKILKDVKNQVTRRVNCENRNLQKTVKASADDVILFSRFLEAGGAEHISEELLTFINTRIEHPECSLTDLAALHGNLSRSGANHRLRKIREIATNYLEQQDQN